MIGTGLELGYVFVVVVPITKQANWRKTEKKMVFTLSMLLVFYYS